MEFDCCLMKRNVLLLKQSFSESGEILGYGVLGCGAVCVPRSVALGTSHTALFVPIETSSSCGENSTQVQPAAFTVQ